MVEKFKEFSCPFRNRCHTIFSVDKGQDVGLQLDALRDEAERRGWQVAGEYVDDGISGAKSDRPALQRLLSDVERGHIDLVAVWKLDRLGRSLAVGDEERWSFSGDASSKCHDARQQILFQ